MSEVEIKIYDTTNTPEGKHIGIPYVKENTAEYFRQSVLVPALTQHETILIDFINPETKEELSIAASWLEEAFAGLIKYGYLTLDEFKRRVRFKPASNQRFYNLKVNQYVSQAVYSSDIYVAPLEGHSILQEQHSQSDSIDLNNSSRIFGKFNVVASERSDVNTKRYAFVYETDLEPHQQILCLELELYFPSSLQFVVDGAIKYEPLLNSLSALHLLDQPEFMEYVKSYNLFSCDRDEIEEQLEELSNCTFLRRLKRKGEVTTFDPYVYRGGC